MDEADLEGMASPQIGDQLVAQIADLLRVFDSKKREYLASRLKRCKSAHP